MRPLAALIAATASLILSACATSAPDAAAVPARTVWIVGGDGRAVGQATFTEATNGILIRLEFSDRSLPPGWHGLHLHGHGDCSDFAAGFQASGGHARMGRRAAHGLRNEDGPEAGDLPNIFIGPIGPSGAELFSPFVTLGPTVSGTHARQSLLDEDGAALVIHAEADDHQSQPIGGAGARIACAALTRLP
jgi:Cu-Zn family superoxide dismutase